MEHIMTTFEELGVEPQIIKAIGEIGFEHPMPVQEKVISYLMREDAGDMIALAQTGTGKTAAFGIPLIQKTNPSDKNIQHLVLCPTRELCLQIGNDLESYSKYKNGIKIAAVYGGASVEKQIKDIKKGAQIVSATPGRLNDLIDRGVVNLSKVKTVVLDEADEMLNMGFRDELESILAETPAGKNTLLFSATMPNEVMTITKRYMKNPEEITIGKRNSGAENVEHVCYMVHAKDRYLALKRIADFYPEIYGIIFCRTRYETKEVAEQLVKDGYNAEALHGDLSQQQRDAVMSKFRIKHLKLLVATDVAARGLDVDSLTHIINYNLPEDLEIYTHRSGRTGRAGRTGISIIIANLKEKHSINAIEKRLNKKFKYLPVPSGNEICEKQLFYLVDRMQNVELNDKQIDNFLPDIYKKLEAVPKEELIKRFVSLEFNRFLDYYKNANDLNTPSESASGKSKDRSGYGFTRFFISIGKTDGLKPASLIGLINDFTGIRNIEIGEIEILKNFSFFEADSSFKDKILGCFQQKSYNKRKIGIEIASGKKGSRAGKDENVHDKKRVKKNNGKDKLKKDRKKKRH